MQSDELNILETLDIFEGLDPEKDKWDALIEAVAAGNVVPVIGPDIICDYPNNLNINEFIINAISSQLHLKDAHTTFSQLVYDPEFLVKLNEKSLVANRDVIYGLVSNLFNSERNIDRYFKPSDVLNKLLSLKLFPFVITTNYSPVVENAMRNAWGNRNVKVLSFCRNPQKDTKAGIGDITTSTDMLNPTVYYMFGKASNQPHSYVLTDNDMLEFCQSWLSEQTRPNNLCAQLKDKYLLMLGCGYSDWLFRFIWFCMNKTSDSKTKGLMAKDKSTHETLVEYLRRIDTFLPSNKTAGEIVTEIERRIAIYNRTHSNEWFSKPPKIKTQVFLSYSRSDSGIADALYNFLTEQGLSVWYDKNNLLGGSQFMDEIEDAIVNTKVFVPILSRNIDKEAMDAHVYRKEWNIALGLQESMGKRNFIIPVHHDNFDFYNADIPKGLESHNSIPISGVESFSKVLIPINEALNKLDNFKSLETE